MKKVLTQDIGSNRGQPVGRRTLEHLQSGFLEAIAATLEAVNLGRKQIVYLHGCVVTSDGANNHTTTTGVAFFAGEVFAVDAATVNSATAPEWVIETTYDNGGPVPFSNQEFINVLAIRKLKLVPAGSGGVALDQCATFDSLVSTMPSLVAALNGKAASQQPAWQNLILINGAVAIDNESNYPAQYLIDTLGFVHLRGSISVPADSGGFNINLKIIDNLPAAIRPAKPQSFLVITDPPGLGNWLFLSPGNGGIYSANTHNSHSILLDGITYQADGI